MKTIIGRFRSLVLLGCCLVFVIPLNARPLKVFILAGQSNMQGHAQVETFDYIGDDPATAPLLQEMRGADGKPRVLDRVWISSIGCLGDAYSDLTEKTGLLMAGFGAPENKIGPEFTFGICMDKLLGEPILFFKTAWGGRSLHTDFRPPSAGKYEPSVEEAKRWAEKPERKAKKEARRFQRRIPLSGMCEDLCAHGEGVCRGESLDDARSPEKMNPRIKFH